MPFTGIRIQYHYIKENKHEGCYEVVISKSHYMQNENIVSFIVLVETKKFWDSIILLGATEPD